MGMGQQPGGGARSARPIKEPVRRPWIWIVLTVIMLAAIPWYLPTATIGVTPFGLPFWMLISVGVTLIMCGYVSWLCVAQWDVVEAEEERGAGPAARHEGDGG